MAPRRRGRPVHGVFLLDKPAGVTSNQALQLARKLFQAQKAGHTGTLDPFATGLLPLCFGEATKTAGFMLESRKTYQATCRLGVSTDSGDTEGSKIAEATIPNLEERQLSAVLERFTGVIEQLPPMYSAIRHQGRRLYELAREGIEVQRQRRSVEIFRLQLTGWQLPLLSFEVECSKGTYIRTLAEDLAQALGTCGHLQSLRRTRVQPFDASQMHTLDELREAVERSEEDDLLLPVDAALQDWPALCLEASEADRFCHGNPVDLPAGALASVLPEAHLSEDLPQDDSPATRVRVRDEFASPLGLGEVSAAGLLKPVRVFVWPSS